MGLDSIIIAEEEAFTAETRSLFNSHLPDCMQLSEHADPPSKASMELFMCAAEFCCGDHAPPLDLLWLDLVANIEAWHRFFDVKEHSSFVLSVLNCLENFVLELLDGDCFAEDFDELEAFQVLVEMKNLIDFVSKYADFEVPAVKKSISILRNNFAYNNFRARRYYDEEMFSVDLELFQDICRFEFAKDHVCSANVGLPKLMEMGFEATAEAIGNLTLSDLEEFDFEDW